jgi:hypothetical protein
MSTAPGLRSRLAEKLRRLQVTPAVIYYFVNRTSQLVTILVTILLVTTSFTPLLQGYYYTILSLMSFQVLADLGLAIVLTQFVSHEWPDLAFSRGKVVGNVQAVGRLRSLVRIALAWIIVMGLIVMTGLLLAGYAFIHGSQPDADVHWQWPWAGACLGVALCLAGSIISAINVGCDQVARSQRAAAISTGVSYIASWAAILLGWDLYAIAVQRVLQGIILIAILSRDIWPALRLCLTPSNGHHIRWSGDFLRQQWRTGVSWLSGVAIYQSFVPILFHFVSPVEAGRAGLMLQAYTFANILAASWIQVAQPQFGQLWARRDMAGLATLVNQALAKSFLTAIVCGTGLITLITLIHAFLPHYATRLGTVADAAILMASCIVIQILNAQTYSVRFSKTEPFLMLCVTHAMAMIVLNLLLAPFGAFYMYVGFLAVLVVIVTPWSNYIYKRNVGQGWTESLKWLAAALRRNWSSASEVKGKS